MAGPQALSCRPWLLVCWVFSLQGLVPASCKWQQDQPLARRFILQQPDGASAAALVTRYLDNAELEAEMKRIAAGCGGIASVKSWGQSAKGQELVALELYAGDQEERWRPAFKYVGNLHGDEPTGRQLLLALAEHLCRAHQAKVPDVVRLLGTVSVFLIPTANPDGYAMHTRENSHGIDLNRNYPDAIVHPEHDLKKPQGSEQPETLAMMNLTLSRRFIGSLALHEGAIVANYPFDGYPDGTHALRGTVNPSPDQDTFVHLAKTYAKLHTTMSSSREFPDGITNGAQWYPVYGGMQDWNYLAAGCLEITLELNDNKHPEEQRLAAMWEENRQAMVQYPIRLVLGGLRGSVFSSAPAASGSRQPLLANIQVQGQGYNVTSGPKGDYYRPLAPGQYTIVVTAPDHNSTTHVVLVPETGQGAVLDVTLPSLLPPPKQTAADAAPAAGATGGQVGEVYVLPSTSHLSWLYVGMYVLAGPLLVGAALVLWRSTRVRKWLEPAYAMVGLSTAPWSQREHGVGLGDKAGRFAEP